MKSPTAPIHAVTLAGPAGPIHVAATSTGVVAVGVAAEAEDFEASLARRLHRPVVWLDAADRRPALLDEAAAAIGALVAGAANAGARLDAIPLDLDDRPAWDREVLAAVRAIPRGQVRSYGEIALEIGRPGAARAVGGAVGRNPVSMLVPCHRVIAGDGTLGGYGGGWWGDAERNLQVKEALLAGEGVHLSRSRPRGDRGR